MRFQTSCAALLGAAASLVAAAPTDSSVPDLSQRGLKWKSRAQKRAPLAVQLEVQETNIIVVENNQAQLDAVTQLAEQQFAQLVQAQIALATQLQTVKDNIRLNSFASRFVQVNTVIVTVSTMIDARAEQGNQQRYMVNQLLIDNGKPDQVQTIMVSDSETMTIGASQTVQPDGVIAASAGIPTATPMVMAEDAAAPFGQVNQNVILPIGAAAPSIDLVFADPAAIILPGQTDLFVGTFV
ncbi:hypothetical protein F4778DRAFT_787707 [Xylariomycetidae sp. FL2044]|nr:hypothetical protein F4778DRAFT_787707 [Xylariomycetidae sp. FL2044]